MSQTMSLVLVWMVIAVLTGMAARPEPENRPRPEARTYPHVEWCHNYEGGTPSVLFIANQYSAWDVYALAQRMDLAYDVFYTTQPWTFATETDYYHEGIVLLPEATDQLRGLLEKPWDAVVFVDFNPYNLPAELHYRILEKVAAGMGALTTTSTRWNVNWNYPGITKSQEKAIPAQVLPLAGLSLPNVSTDAAIAVPDMRGNMQPTTVRYETEPFSLAPITAYSVGKGTIINFSPGGSNYFGGAAMHPSRQQSPEELTQAEYFYSLTAKLLLKAAGKSPAVTLTIAAPNDAAPGVELPLQGTTDVPFAGEARVVVRTHLNEVRADQTLNVAQGQAFTAMLPPLPAGRYFVDVWLKRQGKTVDWASTAMTVQASATISAITLDKPAFQPGERLTGSVRVESAPANAVLTASLYDHEQRLLVQQTGIAINGASARLDLPLDRTRELRHHLIVELVAGQQVVATQRVPVFTPQPVENDLFVYTDGVGNNLNGQRRYQLYKECGITCVELGNDAQAPYIDLAMANGLQPGYRIWTTHCDPYTGGCISSPTYFDAVKDSFSHMTKLLDPYGLAFFSIGDDSGVASDFCSSMPNWVRPYVVGLSDMYDGDMNAYMKAHALTKRPFGNFRYMLQQGTLATIAGIEPLPAELPLAMAAWKATYPDIAAFNLAHGTAFASFEAIDFPTLAKASALSPCLLGFQAAMATKYTSVDRLNEAWQTDLKSFQAIDAALIDTQLAAGAFTAKLDKLWYLEDLFLRNMEAAGSGVKGATRRTIGVGMGAASIGNIIPEVLTRINASMPYKGDRDLEIIRSSPHMYCGQTIGVYGGKAVPEAARANQAWETVLTGGNFIWFWSMIVGGIEGDLSFNPGRSGYMLETIQEMQSGLARALIQAKRQHDGIAILHSRRAGALGFFHKEIGSLESSQVGFQRIIEDLGLQYRYTWTQEVESGVLDSGEFKLLILPYTQILSDGEVAAIERFVQQGGTVLADLRCGTHDWSGKPLSQGRLDALFGITQGPAAIPAKADLSWGDDRVPNLRGDASIKATTATAQAILDETPAVLVHKVGKGQAIFLNHAPTTYNTLLGRNQAGSLRKHYLELLATAGIVPRFRIETEPHGPAAGAEMAVFRRGGIDYLTIEKNTYEFETYPLKATIQLDKAYHVYDMRAGKDLGQVEAIPAILTGLGTSIYALLSNAPKPMQVTIPSSAKAGDDVPVSIALGTLDAHTLRIDVWRPDGSRLWPMIKLEGQNGNAAVTIPLAINDPAGAWKITVTDVTTGRHHEHHLEVTR